ncbi:hypothetical protein XA68_14377 [Ophiocordyceps unilateralis]|uniref:Uncharacterized protein n=1 Tax=Ophiocordyceps unilateralis TaxID=268505 RepID=A0A2A9PN60_OPHUN|nr:hypothetical protein XA68_14377 [Ophiocordyceps unilateralis]
MTLETTTEIDRTDLQDPGTIDSALITTVKCLSSYNWVEAPTPTIAVPGAPPLWTPPKEVCQLKKDSGLIYTKQNAARHPNCPLEPLFRSLFITNPSFDVRSVDVIADRNSIRKLLFFANPNIARRGIEPFSITIEVIRDTTIMYHLDSTTHEDITPNNFRGYNREFEKTYTTNQIEGSTGHYKIISYSFYGLNLIVRHKSDGCVKTDASPPTSGDQCPGASDVSQFLDTLSVSLPKRPDTASAGSELKLYVLRHSTPSHKSRVQ